MTAKHLLLTIQGDYVPNTLPGEIWQTSVRLGLNFQTPLDDVGLLPDNWEPVADPISRTETDWTISSNWKVDGPGVFTFDPGDYLNGPVLPNDVHGDPQMNELWLYFHRPVETDGCGVDVGGRVDLLYGTDWRVAYFHGLGMEDEINSGPQLYGFSVPQFYLEAAVNNLSVKMGRMTGVLGYEIVPPMGNFFYSHS